MVVWLEDPLLEIKSEAAFQSLFEPKGEKPFGVGTVFSCN